MEKQKKKFYRTQWFLWIWLIIFPPIGLVLLWACHKEMKNKSRIILTVVFAIWFLILRIAINGDASTTPTVDTNPSSTTSAVKAVESSESAQEASESTLEPNEMPREISVQDAEDACNSFFSEVG